MRSRSRVATGVAVVLAIAVPAFVLRGALEGDAAPGVRPNASGAAVMSSGSVPLSSAARNVIPEDASTIATARKRSVLVYARPGGDKGPKRVRARSVEGQPIPLTFLVRRRVKGWVKVDLPTRPNKSRGWVRRGDVDLSFTRLRLEVRTKQHRVRLLDGSRVVSSARIAVGRALSPTPPGRYFVTDIIRSKDPKGFYGPYALGLSAHSTVYTSFAGGNGQVGLHGTNQPSVLGRDVSAGCVRVRNDVIRRLARRVPLGTPVVIRS